MTDDVVHACARRSCIVSELNSRSFWAGSSCSRLFAWSYSVSPLAIVSPRRVWNSRKRSRRGCAINRRNRLLRSAISRRVRTRVFRRPRTGETRGERRDNVRSVSKRFRHFPSRCSFKIQADGPMIELQF